MRYSDFCRMSPVEFYEASKAFAEAREQESHERWEIMRTEASILIQPHVKGKITPRRLLPFPWDTAKHDEEPEEVMTMEERHRRAEEALRKWG